MLCNNIELLCVSAPLRENEFVLFPHPIGLRELAQRLDREHSFVWRIETGERRLDVVEFAWVCHALNQDAASVYMQMATRWNVYLPAPHPANLAAERPVRPYGMKGAIKAGSTR